MEASSFTTVEPDPAGYALAYDEAKRALAEQVQSVDELRSRAGTLIAAAAITTSFLGSALLQSSHLPTLGWLAIGFFVVTASAVLAVLWPWHDWEFTVNAASFIRDYLEPPDDQPLALAAIHRDLALHMETAWQANRDQFRWLQRWFRLATVMLVIEVVLWIIALATR